MGSTYVSLFRQLAEVLGGLCFYTLAAILIHEVGHALIALLLGFEIISVRVGPADLKYEEKWSLALNSASWGYGFVRIQFRGLPGPLAPLQCIAFLMGGPLANLLVAVLLALFSPGENFFGRVCVYLMLACILVAVSSLIPVKSKLGLSDGAKLVSLLFRPRWRRDFLFRLSLKARVAEIIALSRTNELLQAIQKADEFKARFLSLPGVRPEATLPLERMQEAFQKTLTAASAPKAETEVSEAKPPGVFSPLR